MVAVFQCLGPNEANFRAPCAAENKVWAFTRKNIPNTDHEKSIFLRPLIQNHGALHLEYNLHCAQLVNHLLAKKTAGIITLIQQALMMAELLEQIYRPEYLNVSRKVTRFQLEQKTYRHWLTQEGYQFPEHIEVSTANTLPVSATIRYITSKMSWLRLFLLRSRQLLMSISRAFDHIEPYAQWASRMEQWTILIVAYGVWLFYIPRVFSEIFFTLKHTLPHAWMSKNERTLGWTARLSAQWAQRWYYLIHDPAWLCCGIITCFLCVGSLTPAIAYILCAMQVFDLVLSTLRSYVDIARFQKIENAYISLRKNAQSDQEIAQCEDYLRYLDQRISYERKRRNVLFIYNAILVLTATLMLPFLGFNPMIAFAGALLAVAVTLACYATLKWLEKKKPNKGLSITSISLFKPKSKFEPHPVVTVDNHESESLPLLQVTTAYI